MGVNELLTLSSYSFAQSLGFILGKISTALVSYSCRRLTHAMLCRAVMVIFNVKWSVPVFAKPGYSEFLFRVVSGHCECWCLKLNRVQELGFSF